MQLRPSHFSEGRWWLEQALAASEGASAVTRAFALMGTGTLAEQQGDYARAVPLHEAALALFNEVGHPFGAGWTLQHLGSIAVLQGNYGRGVALLEESLASFRETGNQGGIASLLMYLGIAACYQGDYERAATLLEESLPSMREVGDGVAVARALHGLGIVAHHQGDVGRAKALFEEGLTAAQERGARLEVAQCLEGLAGVAGAEGEKQKAERAAGLFGAVEALRITVGTPLSPAERSDLERSVESVRAQLDEAAFAVAWAEGRAMTMEQAVAYAQESAADRSAYRR